MCSLFLRTSSAPDRFAEAHTSLLQRLAFDLLRPLTKMPFHHHQQNKRERSSMSESPLPHDTHPWRRHYGSQTRNEIGPFEFLNLADMIAQNSKRWAEVTAFTMVLQNGMTGSLTYTEVDELSDDFAVYLKEELKLKKGERVAIQMPNCLAYPVAVFGTLKAGCVVVNTNPLYTPSEMQHQFHDSGAKVLVVIDMFADKLPEALLNTSVEKVILASAVDLFPALKKTFLKTMIKYVKKQVPNCVTPHVNLEHVLAQGRWCKQTRAVPVYTYWRDVSLDDLCALQYTGGTTGVSKGAMLTHQNIMANMYQIIEVGKTKIELKKETILTVLPLYHIFAFTLNLMTFYNSGAHNILVPNPRPLKNIKAAILNYPLTWISGVNTLFNGLLNEDWFVKNPPRHLKSSIAGGSALHAAVAERWLKVVKTQVIEGFGLTETSPVVTFNPIDGMIKADTVGVPVPSTDVVLVNDEGAPVPLGEAGEIAVKGPQVMKGYWQRPDETKKAFKNGWLLTGDIGVMDADGYFKIVDRKKDMIIVSGFNVYPNEVEDCIAKHDGVQEVAVVGLQHERTGECIKAYIVKKTGADFSEKEIIEHCKKYLTSYKVPKKIEFRVELPKTPIGKILRKNLRNEAHGEARQVG